MLFAGGSVVEISNDPCRREVWSERLNAIREVGAGNGGGVIGAADGGHEEHQHQCK